MRCHCSLCCSQYISDIQYCDLLLPYSMIIIIIIYKKGINSTTTTTTTAQISSIANWETNSHPYLYIDIFYVFYYKSIFLSCSI